MSSDIRSRLDRDKTRLVIMYTREVEIHFITVLSCPGNRYQRREKGRESNELPSTMCLFNNSRLLVTTPYQHWSTQFCLNLARLCILALIFRYLSLYDYVFITKENHSRVRARNLNLYRIYFCGNSTVSKYEHVLLIRTIGSIRKYYLFYCEGKAMLKRTTKCLPSTIIYLIVW